MISYDRMGELFKDKEIGTYIVELAYAYDWDIRPTLAYEVCEWDGSVLCWFNDWWEGQEQISVLNIYYIEELIKKYKKMEGAANDS